MKKNIIPIFILGLLLSACSSFLDKVPNSKLAVPSELRDLQLLLENPLIYTNAAFIPQVLTDDYYVTTTNWNGVADERIRNLYLWGKDENNGWNKLYQGVYNANVVLDELEGMDYNATTESELRDRITGSALFFRAFYHFWATQLYCRPYDRSSAPSDLGVPIKKSPDISEPIMRLSVQESYDEILNDLKLAVHLLPIKVDSRTLPDRSAAYGLLARVYLTMGDFESSYRYADTCINLFGDDKLLNFNNSIDVNLNGSIPFHVLNKEVIFHAIGYGNVIINQAAAKIDSNLYALYDKDDLRKVAYFRTNTGANAGTYAFKGRYDNSTSTIFFGIALNEMLLIRAETAVRLGQYNAAIADLNKLLNNRWRTDTYIPYNFVDENSLLKKIIQERRKELVYRGLRWVDIRRLNVDPDLIGTVERIIDGERYQLEPNSERLTILIPQIVINHSGIEQNP